MSDDLVLTLIIYGVLASAIFSPLLLLFMARDAVLRLSLWDAPQFGLAAFALAVMVAGVGWIGWTAIIGFCLLLGGVALFGPEPLRGNLYAYGRLTRVQMRLFGLLGVAITAFLLIEVPTEELLRLLTVMRRYAP